MSFLVLRAYLRLIQFDLYLARGDFEALYNKVRNCPVGEEGKLAQSSRTNLHGSGYGVYLVLERGALPAAFGGYGMFSQETWSPSSTRHRHTATAVQGSRVGRSGRACRERQAIHARDIRSARQVLEA